MTNRGPDQVVRPKPLSLTLTRAEYSAERDRLSHEIRIRAQELARRIEERRHADELACLGSVPREAVSPVPALEPGDPGYGAQVERQMQEVIPHG